MDTNMPDYPIPRDSRDSARLDYQHPIYVRNIGYLIHPRIKAALPNEAKIADVGTGTGIWLKSVQQEVSSECEFHGFDISKDQFPTEAELGFKCQFHRWNMLHPFPDKFHGQFDIVHLRMVAVAMQYDSWRTVAENCKMLLKPGGWIQWTEVNWEEFFGLPLRGTNLPDVSYSATDTAFYQFTMHFHKQFVSEQGGMQKDMKGSSRLPQIFKDIDLTNSAVDLISTDRDVDTRKAITWLVIITLGSIGKQLAAAGNMDLTVDDIDHLLSRCELELEGGTYHRALLYTMIGQKLWEDRTREHVDR